MEVQVFLDSFEREKALKRFIRIKMKHALKKHERIINHVEVRIRDLNADKGGSDKACTIIVDGKVLGRPMVINEVSDVPGRAFRGALKRALLNVREELRKTKTKTRGKRQLMSLQAAASAA